MQHYSNIFKSADEITAEIKQIKDIQWTFDWDSTKVKSAFQKNSLMFTGNGGDCFNLLTNCKIAHSKRLLSEMLCDKKKLTLSDFEKGLDKFRQSKQPPHKSLPKSFMYI